MTSKNISPTNIAKSLGISVSTISGWKNDEKLLSLQRDQIHAIRANKVKRLRQLDNSLVDEATWMWFKDQRKSGSPITGPIIQAQAIFFFWQHLETSKKFEASTGWLDKWKKRHQIRNVTLCGEKKSADYDAATEYPKEEVDTSTFKVQKERITAMACSNACAIIKLPLVVIGKFAKPRAIKNLQYLPLSYKSQKSAWMSRDIFSSLFFDEFVPFVAKKLEEKNLPAKAILFADNCSAHGDSLKSGDIEVVFLPPNTTSILQSKVACKI
ncbi:jerky protein homolog-like [Aphidius gifuensis]|uniref:jerky protein homolog-like n=1 Tax=Aphidius gifuensis TaxID=684658 RepID=UPI001CDD8A8F|nr:jerky protein homolog-like [Aphidius gifuensis]